MEGEAKKAFNQSMMVMVNNYQPNDIRSLPDLYALVSTRDKEDFFKNVSNLFRNIFIASALGLGASVMTSKYNFAKILERPVYVRLPLRLSLIALPNLFILPSYFRITRENNKILHDVQEKIMASKKAGNISPLDPDGALFKQFMNMYLNQK